MHSGGYGQRHRCTFLVSGLAVEALIVDAEQDRTVSPFFDCQVACFFGVERIQVALSATGSATG